MQRRIVPDYLLPKSPLLRRRSANRWQLRRGRRGTGTLGLTPGAPSYSQCIRQFAYYMGVSLPPVRVQFRQIVVAMTTR